jgi:hypothetical protein
MGRAAAVESKRGLREVTLTFACGAQVATT